METVSAIATNASSGSPALEVHIGYWLRRVSNRVSGNFMRSIGERGVSGTEWVALQLIAERDTATTGHLAGLMDVTKGAVSKVAAKLEKKGWIERTMDAEDSRVQWLRLTRRGSRLVPQLAAVADANDEQFFGCLSGDERNRLLRILRKLSVVHGLRETPVD